MTTSETPAEVPPAPGNATGPTPRSSGPTLAVRAGAAFAAYQGGDRERMGELVDLVTPLLWHTVRAQRVGPEAAEDVVQTTWLRLVHHAEAIQDPQAVLAWLIVTAKRESWRVVKDSRRATPLPEDEDGPPLPDLVATGPETAALARLEGTVLWTHVESLPERCRSLLRVIAFSDRPDYATVATALGMPVGSIGPTRGRCLAKLRLLLDHDPHWGTT